MSNYIEQVCGRLGISLVHAQPYSAACKGKIERFNGTISRMFYPLVEDFASLSIDQLNRQFSTFVNDIYHTKVHSSLGQSPREKFQTGLSKTTIRRIDDNQLTVNEFFLSDNFKEALSRLEYMKVNRGFALVSGSCGVGKTTVLRYFAESLNPKLFKVVYIPLATVSVTGFYRHMKKRGKKRGRCM